MCVCARARARACVRSCMHACVCARACVRVCVLLLTSNSIKSKLYKMSLDIFLTLFFIQCCL